jgi:predicted membrane protein
MGLLNFWCNYFRNIFLSRILIALICVVCLSRFVHQINEVFSWVIQLVIWQTLSAFIFGIKLSLKNDSSSTRLMHFTVIYVLEMLCYCYLSDDINKKVLFFTICMLFTKICKFLEYKSFYHLLSKVVRSRRYDSG